MAEFELPYKAVGNAEFEVTILILLKFFAFPLQYAQYIFEVEAL